MHRRVLELPHHAAREMKREELISGEREVLVYLRVALEHPARGSGVAALVALRKEREARVVQRFEIAVNRALADVDVAFGKPLPDVTGRKSLWRSLEQVQDSVDPGHLSIASLHGAPPV